MKTSATTTSRRRCCRASARERGQYAATRMTDDLDVADQNVGHDFADEHFARARRHREKIFHRAALAFARDGEAGDHDHRHGENHAHEAGDDIVLGDDFGVVERVNRADRSGRSCRPADASGPLKSLCNAASKSAPNEPRAVPVGGGIGRVGLDEQRWPVAAQQIAAEVFRNIDDKLHLAAREQLASFGFGLHLADEIEIGAVLHRVKQRASLRPVVGQKHSGRQMPRVGVDGVTKQA